MRLEKKSFIFGAGTGIIIASLMLYIVYGIEYRLRNNEILEISDEEIIERANDLGMVKAKDILDKAREDIATISELTTDDIINQAIELGMVFPATEVDEVANDEVANDEVSNDEEVSAAEITSDTPIDDGTLTQEEPQEYVLVTIRAGSSANRISRLLEQSGVITNAEDFNNFMIRKNVTTTIMVGTFNLPLNGDYEEILKIIRDRNMRVSPSPR